jgi:dihydrofolate reductase
MGSVIVDITMSLDGFVTAPNDGPDQGLGDEGEVLHYWVFGGPWQGDEKRDFASTGVDGQVLNEALHAAGASVVGRRMYDITDGWGGQSPFGPCVVVTHRVDDRPDPASGFDFVDGVGPAIARAREIARDKDVNIGGGASVVQQALRAGLVDELHLHIAPVILGAGRPLFGELGLRLHLEPVRILESPYATHINYRIVPRST